MKKNIIIFILTFFSILYSQTNIKKYIDFELPSVDDEKIKLSEKIEKKVVLLNFWASWCPFCVKEIPTLKSLYDKYKDYDLEIISINIGEPKKKVSNFVKKNSIKYKVLLDHQANIARLYNVRGIPTNFLINKNGEIIFSSHSLPDENIIKANITTFKKKGGN